MSVENLTPRSVRPFVEQPLFSMTALGTFIAYALLSLMILGPYMTFKELPYTGEGSPYRQLSYFLILILAIYVAYKGHGLKGLLALPLTMAITLTWFWITISWAIAPGIAIRRLILTTLLIVTIFISVRELGTDRIITVMRKVFAFTLLVNYVFAIAIPSVGVHNGFDIIGFGSDPGLSGDWKGIMEQKNFAGALCMITALIYLFDQGGLKVGWRFFMILASTYFLYRSGSKTSLGLVAIALPFGLFFRFYNVKLRAIWVAMVITVVIGIATAIMIYWAQIAAHFDSPDALTGRVQIWPILVNYWHDHPFGSGFGSFWNIGDASPSYIYAKQGSWVALVPIGHNGYLDILAQTGTVGLILAIIAVAVAPLWKLMTNPAIGNRRAALLASMLVFCLCQNMMETSVFDRDSLMQTILMYILAMIEFASREKVASRAPGLGHAR